MPPSPMPTTHTAPLSQRTEPDETLSGSLSSRGHRRHPTPRVLYHGLVRVRSKLEVIETLPLWAQAPRTECGGAAAHLKVPLDPL